MEYYFRPDSFSQVSPANCSGDPHRSSCQLLESEEAKRDVMAVIRMVVSILSLLGSLSIIISAIVKKQVCSPKIHPIFMLSIADSLLALLWTIGGSLWLYNGVTTSQDAERVGCFTVLLMTVILECVAVNLTLIYALLAYSAIKQKDFSTVYLLFDNQQSQHVWKPWKTIVAYVTAWMVPVILIMLPFGIIAGRLHIVKHANKCSCWCLPYFGNVIPLASPGDIPTAKYLYRLRGFVASYGIVVALHYVLGFILLVTIYVNILRRIKKMRRVHEQNRSTHNLYGATEALIIRGQSQAKKRVILFLTVFVFSGLFNLLLSVAISVDEIKELFEETENQMRAQIVTLSTFELGVYMLQSVTVPLQGFLNALVYGWTREDFLHVIVRSRDDMFAVDSGRSNNINSPLAQSTNNDDEREVFFSNNSDLISSMDEQEDFDRGPLYTLPEDTEPEYEDEVDD